MGTTFIEHMNVDVMLKINDKHNCLHKHYIPVIRFSAIGHLNPYRLGAV